MFADTGSRIHLSVVVCIVIHERIHHQQQAEGNDLATPAKEGVAAIVRKEVWFKFFE